METECSSRTRAARCDEGVEIWAPRLGIVRGRRTWRVSADDECGGYEWQVMERGEQRPLILELVTSGDGWPRHTARVWEAPPWVIVLGERLGAAPDVRRIRSVLLAGLVPATQLFDIREDCADDDEDGGMAWHACELDGDSEHLTARARVALERTTRQLGLELDASRFATCAAARAESVGESNGVAVIGYQHLRAVSVVTFAGAPALFVASATALDDEPIENAITAHAPELRLVPFAGTERAAEVLLEHDPGFALPRTEISDAQEERS